VRKHVNFSIPIYNNTNNSNVSLMFPDRLCSVVSMHDKAHEQ